MTGQLSDDGNFMWNGNEWVPVEQQAAPAAPMAAAEPMAASPMAAAAPMVVSPHTDMGMAAAPAATVMVATSGGSSGGGLDFTRGFSTLKYGLAALLSSILTVILIGIVNTIIFVVAADSGDGAVFIIAMLLAVMFNILAFTQVITLVMGMGIADGLGKSGLGYMGSWKTAFTAILESIPVLLTAAIMFGVGLGMLEDSAGVAFLLLFLSGTIILLFQMGLMAFMARKVATDL
jgi:hypothetical protein